MVYFTVVRSLTSSVRDFLGTPKPIIIRTAHVAHASSSCHSSIMGA